MISIIYVESKKNDKQELIHKTETDSKISKPNVGREEKLYTHYCI